MGSRASKMARLLHLCSDYNEKSFSLRYTLLEESQITSKLASYAHTFDDTCSVSFQPYHSSSSSIEDRWVVQKWDLPDGVWRFAAVFDGHGGTHTAEYTASALPGILRERITSVTTDASPTTIAKVLGETITDFDRLILHDLLDIFPGGVDAISALSDDEIHNILSEGTNGAKLMRCMRGTTVLISLVDPLNTLYIASLGDCQAVLGFKGPNDEWETRVLSSNHNGDNSAERDRIRDEHPGEPGCIVEGRILGGLAVTRALGDFLFKLPPIYTEKLFLNVNPGYRTISKVKDVLSLNLTPPYVSNIAEIQHVDLNSLNASGPRYLVMCSDGLTDLYPDQSLEMMSQKWIHALNSSSGCPNLAVRVLRDALGGDDLDKVSQSLTLEASDQWIDDTTVIVQSL